MTRLLHKPLKAFALYALIILIISVPVYVLVIDYIWISELDENNLLTLQHTKQTLESKKFSQNDIEDVNHIWGELQPGFSIFKAKDKTYFRDSIYEIVRANNFDESDSENRFRGLKSKIELNGESYFITIETNVEESDETFFAIAIVTFVFFLLMIIGFILLNNRISSRTWKPFYQTLFALKSYELSKEHGINLPTSEIVEFQLMNESLEQMVNNNVDVYRQQKLFTENASHELQTPIALIKSKIDLLIQYKNIPPEMLDIVNSINAPLSRLSRINKNLLLLAKVENQQYSGHKENNLVPLIQSTLDLFEDYIIDKKLKVSNQVQGSINVTANPYLLETLIHNLLSNAIRHTSAEGKIIIKNEGKAIYFLNSGIDNLNRKNLFERFSATTKDKVSSGLGLAIVKEIANRYNWKVNYFFTDGFHSFSLVF
ncbi:MAG: HAMP domain-containing histidine kinase [Cyclobacteriaceae bacterium]|nr:HAMP domain-containing histidine kinase [Cyclobacteriaceae bacterium]